MGVVAKTVGKMPFAGRAIVENAYHWSRSEQSSFGSKLVKGALSAGFLAAFAALHVTQAKMGIADFTHDWAELTAHPSAGSGLETTVSGLYTAANVAVIYTQAQLGMKTVGDTALFGARELAGVEQPERRAFSWENARLHELAFTLGGQVLFAAMNDVHH
ncbi:hypothetical protein KC957_00415 [Candidatus Saccharibacteria bacterium]|nr:hypothetical protein [Candidatus Saccharibacteria bacterium]